MAPFIGNLTLEHQDMIEFLFPTASTVRNILVALASEVELFQRNADGCAYFTRKWHEYQVALQMWETAYVAAGGNYDGA